MFKNNLSVKPLVITMILVTFLALLFSPTFAKAAVVEKDPTYTITKDGRPYTGGGVVVFEVSASITNEQPGTVAYAVDDLPDGFNWGISTNDACSILIGKVHCVLFVDNGGSQTAEFILYGYDTGLDFCGDIVNTATLTKGKGQSGAGLKDSDTAVINVPCPASLKVEKIAVDPSVAVYDLAEFVIRVTNTGDVFSGPFTLSDPLPAGITWNLTWSQGLNCSITKNVLVCDSAGIEGRETADLTVHGVVGTCGTYFNYSTVLVWNAKSILAAPATITAPCPATPTATAPPTTNTPVATSTPGSTSTPAVATPTRNVPRPPNTGNSNQVEVETNDNDGFSTGFLYVGLGILLLAFLGIGFAVANRSNKS